MEGSWQAKCGSPWPPTIPIFQFPASQTQNQVRVGVGQHLHAYPVQYAHTNDVAVREGPMLFDTLNSSPSPFNCKSGKTVAGNHFQTLVSASPQQLQCEMQYPLGSRTSFAAFPLQNLESSIAAKESASAVQGPSLMAWLLQPQGSECIRNDGVPYSVVSVRDLPAVCARVSLPHDAAQTNSFFGGLDPSNPLSCHATIKNGPSSKESDTHRPSCETNDHSIFQHTKGTLNHEFAKTSTESHGVLPVSTYGSLRGCPRVFCLSTSGVLLLSDTGHLGVLCSCHNLHMSVSNFCQHSGLCAADPGDSVRLESGETLRQWRKHNFPKLGIKVLDDNSGWDWPDWNIINPGSLEVMPSNIQNITKNSHMTKDVCTFSKNRSSSQPCSELIVPTGLLVQQLRNSTATDSLGHDAQQRIASGEHDVMKNLVGTSHAATPTFAGRQNILASEHTRVELSECPYRKEPQKDGYQHIVEYLDITSKSGNACDGASQFAENLKPFNSDFAGNRCINSCSVVTPDASSSHVELKLGQPLERGHACGSSVYLKSQSLDVLTDPKKVVSCDQPKQQRDLDQLPPSLQPESLTNKGTDRKSNIYLMRHEFGSINANNHQVNDQVGDNALRSSSSLMSMLYSPIVRLDSRDGGKLSGDTNKLVSSTEQLMADLLGADSQADKCELDDCVKWKIVYPDPSDDVAAGKGSVVVNDISSSRLLSPSSLHHPVREARSRGLPDRNCVPIVSDFRMLQSSSMIDFSQSTPDARTYGLVGFDSSADGDARYTLPPAFQSSQSSVKNIRNPTYLSNFSSTLQGEKMMHPTQVKFGQNPGLLALRNMVMHNFEGSNVDLCKDNAEIYRCSPLQLQRNEEKETIKRPKLNQGSLLAANQDISEVPIQSLHNCSSYCSGVGCPLPCCLAGAKSAWNLIMPHEMTFHSKEKDASCRSCCCNHGHHEQPLLRRGRTIHDYRSSSNEHLHCHQSESNACLTGNLSCLGRLRCLAGNCCARLGSLHEHDNHSSSRSSCIHGSVLDRGSCGSNMEINQNVHHRGSVGWFPGISNVGSTNTSIIIPAAVIDAEEEVECVLQNTSLNNPARAPAGFMWNEQKMSNVCSEESAPSVTKFSASSIDGFTSEVGNAGGKFNSVIDEESGVKRSISSCDATDSKRLVEATLLMRRIDSMSGTSAKASGGKSHNIYDGTRLRNSAKLNNLKKKASCGSNVEASETRLKPGINDFEMEKKGRVFKWKQLNSSLHDSEDVSGTCASQECKPSFHQIDDDSLPLDEHERTPSRNFGSGLTNLKRKRSMLSSAGSINKKMLVHGVEHEDGSLLNVQHSAKALSVTLKHGMSKVLSRKKTIFNPKRDVPNHSSPLDDVLKEKVHRKRNDSLIQHRSVVQEMNPNNHEAKLTVTGNCGIITNGKLAEGFPKPSKFGSLSLILKTAKRCAIIEDESAKFSLVSKAGMACNDENNGCNLKVSICKNEDSEDPSHSFGIVENQPNSVDQAKDELNAWKIRKQSLCELTEKGMVRHGRNEKVSAHLNGCKRSDTEKAACQMAISLDKRNSSSPGKSHSPEGTYFKKNTKWAYQSTLKCSAELYTENEVGNHVNECTQEKCMRSSKQLRREISVLDPEASCSVCQNKDSGAGNKLLECARCLIKVHQACYGVLKLPKGRWCCRPCRTDSRNIICVLCGYQGGAMTCALRSQRNVKSLLQAWKVVKNPLNMIPVSEIKDDEVTIYNSTLVDEILRNEDLSVQGILKTCTKSVSTGKKSCHGSERNFGISICRSDFLVTNTITASLLDPNVKQWVHMVCGLWMPGTRCPNVDTMSAFDVSAVPCPKKNQVCSLCRRPGGSCIKCRIADCRVMFHPWCAHQKGLLQSEIEGNSNENVGFYGRCMLHSRCGSCRSATMESVEIEPPVEKEDNLKANQFTCARTEGYKGRKQEEGFRQSSLQLSPSDGGGCLVRQEQINAWLHINGLKSCVMSPAKPFLASDIEHDSRKEYSRYNQAKGWKNLVVYKSGIHALGLYTSEFIPRGAMVVEYVGEIVGSHVADKRETEYLAGRGVQYKSACYFFRIDKEQIIDATRKGGIARFVNHSCQPNCVAKIISIRNEKKVVFFAERDINPGEEITYDYHFNHEDEGEKIPCFCNAKNCRRYLN